MWLQVGGAGLRNLQGLHRLTHLSLACCQQLDDAALAVLATLSSLAVLCLERCTGKGLTSQGMPCHTHLFVPLTRMQFSCCWLAGSPLACSQKAYRSVMLIRQAPAEAGGLLAIITGLWLAVHESRVAGDPCP